MKRITDKEENAFDFFHTQLKRTSVISDSFKSDLSTWFQWGQRQAYEAGKKEAMAAIRAERKEVKR